MIKDKAGYGMVVVFLMLLSVMLGMILSYYFVHTCPGIS